MFQAFKKLTSASPASGNNNASVSSAGTPMSESLQKKFSRGVQYNMKIIIKGDRNVGKTCLLERLQGHKFVETYTPTEEIQVASIQWSFKATEDVVKVEVWDVVDRGKARVRQTGLKLSTGATVPETPALDAEFLDVYKGTHGVVLMMDVTKGWTFEYVCRELPKIAQDIPVLILGNHCDMSHHRVVSSGQAIGLIESFPRRPAEIMYGESSMRNGFGLRLLHKFLGLPFLRLQRETLLSLLQRNQRETEVCSLELTDFLKSDDADYNKFLDNLVNRRRQIADSNPKILSPVISHSASNSSISSTAGRPINHLSVNNELMPTKSIIVGGGQPIVIPGKLNITNDPKIRSQIAVSAVSTNATTSSTNATKSLSSGDLKPQQSSFIASLFNNKAEVQDALPINRLSISEQKVVSVEEFCPEFGGLDKEFLDDDAFTQSNNQQQTQCDEVDSDSDNDNGNPLVARFNDDLVCDDSSSPIHRKSVATSANSNYIQSIDTDSERKINPLAKNKKSLSGNKSFTNDFNHKIDDFSNNRQNSSLSESGDDINIVPSAVMKLNVNISNDDFNSWLSDTNQRRSPEGGEDLSKLSSVLLEPTASTTVKPLVVNDEMSEEKSRRTSSAKKKKDKKERNNKGKDEKLEKREKKKKRRSKGNDLEEFLSEPTGNKQQVDDAYEAI